MKNSHKLTQTKLLRSLFDSRLLPKPRAGELRNPMLQNPRRFKETQLRVNPFDEIKVFWVIHNDFDGAHRLAAYFVRESIVILLISRDNFRDGDQVSCFLESFQLLIQKVV